MRIDVNYVKPHGWGAGSCTWKLFRAEINIDPAYRNDNGLLHHELFHARGNLLQNWVRAIRYTLSDKYKYQEEVKAYALQIRMTTMEPAYIESLLHLFADYVYFNYDLPASIALYAYNDIKAEHQKL